MPQNALEGTFAVEDFKGRLIKFCTEYLEISQSAFEDSCGISHGTITSIKVKGPSVDILAKISSAYPELNLNWLVMGRGSMLLASPAPAEKPVQNDIHHNATVNINYGALKDTIIEAIREAKL